MPQVSVIVPVYKVEAFLPRCLESIAAQTLRDFECILVDDGSPDGCGALCDAQAARDPRFTVVHKQNGGLSSARNAGLEVAKGAWVVFCDSDDALHPQTLELALAVQATAPLYTLVCWKYGPFPDSLPRLQVLAEARTAANLFEDGYFPSAWSKLWNRELLCAFTLRFDETIRWAEDLDFTTRYLLAVLKQSGQAQLLFIPQVLYFYEQQRPGSLTANYSSAKLSCEFQQLPQLLDLFQQLCGEDLSLWAPFCRHELFVLLSCLSDFARFEAETPPRERWRRIHACLELPCMEQFLSLCRSCHVWPVMTFCARHHLARLCVFFVRNCYKPWYTGTIRAWLWVKNKFYWGWQAIRGLFTRGKV